MAGTDAHYYEPGKGHRLTHDPFKAIIGPRPIGWISSVNATGAGNLAPYSFFNAFCDKPPIIGFASAGWKHSVANVKETGEFVWNLATRALAAQMNATSAHVAAEINEFALAGLTEAPATLVKAARVLESPVNFECRLTQLIQLEDVGGAQLPNWLVLGEVVAVHIDRAALVGGVYDTAGVHPILRAGKLGDYAEITADAMFEMARPDGGPGR